ncbi:BRO family protein [Flavobacterium sp. KACC 22763]|uniref:BRO family protein n=1 Tax=Flavobacterium sp. KACC 22763 TaxID=3025668 RepID=UPI0023657A22|nr:BRO family protein [Flavobacterium sp. KACC 22763]WDF66242.1 BRO family protein [Flavobacterium sp. KACC 22763]
MDAIKVFEDKKVRSHYDTDNEIWYFSIVDIVEALTDSKNPTDYLKKIRKRDVELGSYIGTNCPQVIMLTNGKKRKTLAGNVENIFRIVQSIPSPKAEPFKQWLAKVGYERIQEIQDPVQSIDRARENWKQHGRSEKWIQQRMMGQETRNKLTDYWKEAGIEEKNEFAILTNIIHQEWTGLSVKEHKEAKGLKSQNLRDHMSEAELIFTALAELSTRQIAENDEAKGLIENAVASKKGGAVAKNARVELEQQTGKNVVTNENFLPPADEKKTLPRKK